jgi:hypothetical protein
VIENKRRLPLPGIFTGWIAGESRGKLKKKIMSTPIVENTPQAKSIKE